MKRSAAAAVTVLSIGIATGAFVGGCAGQADAPANTRTPVDQALFAPTAMRLHPAFTQVRDWTGDGQPDGIEAVVEIQDQFGDPTKAAGRILFELYTYRPHNPEPRGQRLVNPWEGRLDSLEDQRARWNRVNRAYIFQLAYPQVQGRQDYVLGATFELSQGGRFFDRTIIEGESGKSNSPTTGPSPLRVTPAVRNGNTAPDNKSTGGNGGAIVTDPAALNPASVPSTSHQPPARNDQP
jgi:hypothetical protein